MRKLLAILLTMALSFSVFGAISAFAEETEGDQPEPVRRIGPHKLPHQPFSLGQTVRFHIVGQHAPGHVEKDHQVSSGSGIGQDAAAPGGPGGGQDGEEHCQEEQDKTESPPRAAYVEERGGGAGRREEKVTRPREPGRGQEKQDQEKGYDPK